MIITIIIVVLVLVVISMYNSLVRKRNQIENAFATIDVMLKQRFDLIPNLVATVQQYAKHEADTFSAITEMRNKTYTALNDSEKADFDKMFSKVRTQFFAVAENYPELKASENFLQLQRSLNETEEQLAAARRTYNASVTEYNNAVQSFPTNLLAGMFGFTRKEVLTIPEVERTTPNVKNLFNS
ncbi:LemA family protein [Bacteroides oleiciplenus]|uniref:LemA family protein n=1 Tax=Bacteroides oleiciplenus TaxID=626931 RepID=UPI0026DC8981|nr:LemA family protein [Bacteroides oleiciplenus]